MTLRTRAGLAVATALGAGYAPKAPGTAGSAVGLLLWLALPHILWLQLLVIAVVSVAGAWSGSVAEAHFGRQDPGQVVVDEVAGMMVTVLLNPLNGPAWVLAAFLLFRAADIVKPFPVNRLERLPGGIGIMADDLAAGIYANLALRLGIWASGHFGI
ncbi:MAG TPA: phosphatidylglycerophosphatase A [Vicinamibacterales bacterium]|nr:phosphatidylglycerophosphatase A [Vicinamibacterales bacterium]